MISIYSAVVKEQKLLLYVHTNKSKQCNHQVFLLMFKPRMVLSTIQYTNNQEDLDKC